MSATTSTRMATASLPGILERDFRACSGRIHERQFHNHFTKFGSTATRVTPGSFRTSAAKSHTSAGLAADPLTNKPPSGFTSTVSLSNRLAVVRIAAIPAWRSPGLALVEPVSAAGPGAGSGEVAAPLPGDTGAPNTPIAGPMGRTGGFCETVVFGVLPTASRSLGSVGGTGGR